MLPPKAESIGAGDFILPANSASDDNIDIISDLSKDGGPPAQDLLCDHSSNLEKA
jgi:hypothetical protein